MKCLLLTLILAVSGWSQAGASVEETAGLKALARQMVIEKFADEDDAALTGFLKGSDVYTDRDIQTEVLNFRCESKSEKAETCALSLKADILYDNYMREALVNNYEFQMYEGSINSWSMSSNPIL